MAERKLINYISKPDVHDGTVLKFEANTPDPGSARVLVQLYDKTIVAFEFHNVQSVRAKGSEGMMLYALSEMSNPPPFRCFVFSDWDDLPSRNLEIVAQDFISYTV